MFPAITRLYQQSGKKISTLLKYVLPYLVHVYSILILMTFLISSRFKTSLDVTEYIHYPSYDILWLV